MVWMMAQEDVSNYTNTRSSFIATWKWRLRFDVIGHHPRLFFAIYRHHPIEKAFIVTDDTEVVLEGFPRAANTFMVLAFQLAQERKVKVAHHTHVPAQLTRAVSFGLPAIVSVREPIDAVTSLKIFDPKISSSTYLSSYIGYHTYLESISDSVIIATFEDITLNFGSVILAMNDKFGTEFSAFSGSSQAVEKVYQAIEKIGLEKTGRSGIGVSKPDPRKEVLKEDIRPGIAKEPLLGEANRIYLQLRNNSRDRVLAED